MWKKLLAVLVVAVVAPRLYLSFALFGFHKSIYNHYPGDCQLVDGINNGSEDMELLGDGNVIITSGLVMDRSNDEYFGRKGRVYMYDFTKAKPLQMLSVEGIDLETFNPHGLTSWHDKKTGNTYIYIINHIPDDDVIEKFVLDSKQGVLTSVKTIGRNMDNVRVINDLVATGEDQFYFTNYLYYHSKLEQFSASRWGSIGYFDGQAAHIVMKGMLLPNGINVSPDHKYLYLAHIGGRSIISYTIEPDHSLKEVHEEVLYTAPDNIYVSPDSGDIWIGCHPVSYKTLRHMERNRFAAPSQVLRVKVSDGHFTKVTEELMDDGELLSGSSVAVYHKDHLLVGTMFQGTLYCKVKHLG